MNYYLHRISYQAPVSNPLLEKGILSIGFSDLSSKEFIERARVNTLQEVVKEFMDQWGIVPNNKNTLIRFLYQMQKGDKVIVPTQGAFSIYEIEDNEPFSTQITH